MSPVPPVPGVPQDSPRKAQGFLESTTGGMPTLSTGFRVGQHRIQGVSNEFIPSILKPEELDPVVSVLDGDSILIAQKLAATLGLGVGISSGANFIGALMVQNEL